MIFKLLYFILFYIGEIDYKTDNQIIWLLFDFNSFRYFYNIIIIRISKDKFNIFCLLI